MRKIGIMKNAVQHYPWGSLTAISDLLGQKVPSHKPQAELWMGAHPKAPSMVKQNGRWISLQELIEKNPQDILGKQIAAKFQHQLPYLFKVIAAARPLSIQAHPDKAQAKDGFKRENDLGIPLDAPHRNYKDDKHKPECLCALTAFWALCGFRKPSDIIVLMRQVHPKIISDQVNDLERNQNPQGLKRFFTSLLAMASDQKKQLVDDVIVNAAKRSNENPVHEWIVKLAEEYPSDIGVLSPILLNLIHLQPGQAIFLPAGELHVYLDGIGVELMANSDNVLRGGLTPKHVDVPELLRVLSFQPREIEPIRPRKVSDQEWFYPCPAEEFVLSVMSVGTKDVYHSPAIRSVEILLCTEGDALLTDRGIGDQMAIQKGTSILVPAAVGSYSIEGQSIIYKAAVPIQA